MIDGFALGPLYIRFYGIILMLGAVAGGWLATIEVKRRGKDPEMVWDLLVYLIIGGVIGARLWHIFTPPPSSIAQGITTQYYLTHPLDAIAIWKEGNSMLRQLDKTDRKMHMLTDLAGGNYYTLILESDYDSLSEYEESMNGVMGNGEWKK